MRLTDGRHDEIIVSIKESNLKDIFISVSAIILFAGFTGIFYSGYAKISWGIREYERRIIKKLDLKEQLTEQEAQIYRLYIFHLKTLRRSFYAFFAGLFMTLIAFSI
jgi:hypothetical protein